VINYYSSGSSSGGSSDSDIFASSSSSGSSGGSIDNGSGDSHANPEPSSLALLGIGLSALLGSRLRKRR
jgi:hypothetical protein